MLVRVGAASDAWMGAFAAASCWVAVGGTRLQHGVPQAKTLNVHVPYRASRNGLHMLIDSTGIKFLGEGEWKTKKHGAERRRQWRKVHLGIDAETLQIRAMVVTTNEVGDSPVTAELLDQIPEDECMPASRAMVPTTRKTCTRPALVAMPSPSFHRAVVHNCEKVPPSRIATKRSKFAEDWAEQSGNTGAATIADRWWKRR